VAGRLPRRRARPVDCRAREAHAIGSAAGRPGAGPRFVAHEAAGVVAGTLCHPSASVWAITFADRFSIDVVSSELEKVIYTGSAYQDCSMAIDR
jgi:hypothetical protein